MALRGKMLGMGSEFRDAIQAVAKSGMSSHRGGVQGTDRILGYVCAIHDIDDEDDELRGTIDVQEYDCDSENVNGQPIGFHEGVFLNAIQNNKSGYYIIPQLYSDVVIQQDPSSHEEYVVMYSHVSVFNLQVHDEIIHTVTEYEDFNESDDGLEKDYDELEEMGKKSTIVQTADGFEETITDSDDNELKTVKTAQQKVITVGDTTITIDGDKVTIETKNGVNIKSDNANIEGDNVTVKGSSVKITGGTLEVKGTSNTDGLGPFNIIKACPFSGALHGGSQVSGT